MSARHSKDTHHHRLASVICRPARKTGLWIYKPALTVRATTAVLPYFKQRLRTVGDPVDKGVEGMNQVFLFKKIGVNVKAKPL